MSRLESVDGVRPVEFTWLQEPEAWMPDAYDEGTRGQTALKSLRRIVYKRESPAPLPSDETTSGPAALYLQHALCPARVSPATIRTIALTCKSWNRFAKFTLQSADFDAFWKRVLWGMAPRSMLHPECASKERLRGWLRGVDEREWLHVERLAALLCHFCNIHPPKRLATDGQAAAAVDFEGWVRLHFDPFVADGGENISEVEQEREARRRRGEVDWDGEHIMTTLASRVCYSIQDFVEWSFMLSGSACGSSTPRTLRWLLGRLHMRFPTSGGTGRNQWPCSEADNTALVRLLKLYAPMLPQRADSDAALDFREEGDDGEEATMARRLPWLWS